MLVGSRNLFRVIGHRPVLATLTRASKSPNLHLQISSRNFGLSDWFGWGRDKEDDIDLTLSSPSVTEKLKRKKKGKQVDISPEEVDKAINGSNPNDDLGYYYSPNSDSAGGNNRNKMIERVQLQVHGGKGGNGCISHEVLAPGKKRPNGGNGGRGGNNNRGRSSSRGQQNQSGSSAQ